MLLRGLGCACCAGIAGTAQARIRPAEMKPLVRPGHRPEDKDEQGLWQQYERVEQEIAGSNLLIRDPALETYVRGLAGRVGGPAASDLRVYLARIPEFNAFIAPTGFMVVFSGLCCGCGTRRSYPAWSRTRQGISCAATRSECGAT
jgi:predicted Zn-dependent protease